MGIFQRIKAAFKPIADVDTGIPVSDQMPTVRSRSMLSTHGEFDPGDNPNLPKLSMGEILNAHATLSPKVSLPEGHTMDGSDSQGSMNGIKRGYTYNQPNISDALAMWYGTNSFIGHQLAAIIAQHWLVLKVCSGPSRDAIRHWFTIVTADGDGIDPKAMKQLQRADKKYGLRRNLLEFMTFGRIFGIRICIFKVDSKDPLYYEQPFNIDGVRPGSYRGMVQIDPYWCSPELDQDAAAQPDTMHFYEPTWWNINGVRYHRSHLVIFRNGMLADILKPTYLYGGIPVPQMIMERVYGAERTANEAPLLALTKRTIIYKTDAAKALSNWPKFQKKLTDMTTFWTNFGQRVIDKTSDEIEQNDTNLADLDALIMTQYQLVAAAGDYPSTKLMGTPPKGFNANGDADAANYHESLESNQSHDLSPVVERHHMLVVKSDMPDFQDLRVEPSWNPLDTPTAKEYAEIDLAKAQTGQQLVLSGAIDGVDERDRVINDKNSDYSGLAPALRDAPTVVGATE